MPNYGKREGTALSDAEAQQFVASRQAQVSSDPYLAAQYAGRQFRIIQKPENGQIVWAVYSKAINPYAERQAVKRIVGQRYGSAYAGVAEPQMQQQAQYQIPQTQAYSAPQQQRRGGLPEIRSIGSMRIGKFDMRRVRSTIIPDFARRGGRL